MDRSPGADRGAPEDAGDLPAPRGTAGDTAHARGPVRVYAGVDPGVTGALAVVTVGAEVGTGLTIHPTPVLWVRVGKSQRRRYEIAPLLDLLRSFPAITLAYVEEQHARPGQGVSSTFAIGYGAGMWHAALVACHIPF